MIRINDIKDDELRELAYNQILEQKSERRLNQLKELNLEVNACFRFSLTKEGMDFWWGVTRGNITKLEQS